MAEVVSELIDTEIYSAWVRRMGTRHQWGRVVASNAVSVPVDSALFVSLAFVGVLPALFTLWVRRNVPEPKIWQESRAAVVTATSARFGDIFKGSMGPLTLAVTTMNGFTMFAWWGFNLWIPAYLSLPVTEGGVGLSTSVMSGLVIAMQVGMWFGYVTFGFISDLLGRKRTYLIYLISAAVLVFLYGTTRNPIALLVLGPFVAFFGTGYFSGFGAVTAEIYPTRIRATAQGFTYNVGRIASAAAPFPEGVGASTMGRWGSSSGRATASAELRMLEEECRRLALLGHPPLMVRLPAPREAAEALRAVEAELAREGFGLKLFDAYRPQRAVLHFVRWARDGRMGLNFGCELIIG